MLGNTFLISVVINSGSISIKVCSGATLRFQAGASFYLNDHMIFILIDIGCSSNEIPIYTSIYVPPSLICRANICLLGYLRQEIKQAVTNAPSFSDLLDITVKIHYKTTQIVSSLHHTVSLDIDKHDLDAFGACSSLTTGVKTQHTTLKSLQACRLIADFRVFALRVFLNTTLAFQQTSPIYVQYPCTQQS
jgi:hypothetical protein